ncbi:MAG TPA: GntR family transcriptional regulator [Succinivibrionaceae bacterium]|nr:GntR family transcriptional regulator [Succinivibrionaceae bacterium]
MNEFYLSTDFAVENTKEPINRQIYRFLKRAIIECRLLPDDPLSENEVASKFKFRISRQPVREALIKLAENDFVVIQPKKTTKVSKISVSDILQGAEIRKAIESHVVKIAVERITDEMLDALEKNVEAQKRAAEQYDLHEHFSLDDSFHRSICEAAGLAKAWAIIEGFKGVMDRMRFLALEYELAPMIITSNAHRKVLEALRNHDGEMAARAITSHVDETKSSLEHVIAKSKKEWFTD